MEWYSNSHQTEQPLLLNSWLTNEPTGCFLGYPHFYPFHCIASRPIAYSSRLRKKLCRDAAEPLEGTARANSELMSVFCRVICT